MTNDTALERLADQRAQARTNTLVMATMELDGLLNRVRVRNLSNSGALIETPDPPAEGSNVKLKRGILEVSGVVRWTGKLRAGVQFVAPIVVDKWLNDKSLGTQDIADQVVFNVKLGLDPPSEIRPIPQGIDGIEHLLNRRISEELSYVARILEELSSTLIDDPVLVLRYGSKMQNFDLATQILSHLSKVLASSVPLEAVSEVSLGSLRSRLLRAGLR